mmetsp:Transcript_29031/g.49492  ORF Transcript_29031/g.49492 Transcript_29031/m.49492 type:complete len:319 (-) Transcript_29031:33-989(-)
MAESLEEANTFCKRSAILLKLQGKLQNLEEEFERDAEAAVASEQTTAEVLSEDEVFIPPAPMPPYQVLEELSAAMAAEQQVRDLKAHHHEEMRQATYETERAAKLGFYTWSLQTRCDSVEDPIPRMPKDWEISYEANRRAKAEMRAQKEWWKKREGSHSATAARQQESVSVRQQLKLIRAQNAQALEAIRTAEAQARKVIYRTAFSERNEYFCEFHGHLEEDFRSRYEQHKALSILCQRLTAAQKKDDVAQEKHRKARRAIRGAEVDTWMLLRNPKIYTKAMTGKWSRPTSAASSSQSLSTKPSAVHFYSPRSRSPSP